MVSASVTIRVAEVTGILGFIVFPPDMSVDVSTGVKVQICNICYNRMYVVLCLFLDNSDSPSIVEQ